MYRFPPCKKGDYDMNQIISSTSKRETYIDFLRITAILFVLYNHTETYGFALFTVQTESPFFVFYLLCSVLCKIAVPLYFMISGALLLRKEEPLSVVLRHRFLKYIVVLFFASLFYYVLRNYDSSLSVRVFFTTLYSSNMDTALWFLYTYLGFLLMLPLLRKFVRTLEDKDYYWLSAIVILFSLIRIIQYVLFKGSIYYNTLFSVPLINRTIYYPLMGYFLANKLPIEKLSKKTILICIGLSFATICINGWLTCDWCTLIGEWKESTCQEFMDELILIPTSTAFIAARYFFTRAKISPRIEKCITLLGSSTFGIYLFEAFYRRLTRFILFSLNGILPTFLATIIWITCAFLVGFAVTQILKRIPIVRNFL